MIDLFSKRKYFFALSIIIILAGFAGMLVNGIQLDIQFQGGTLLQIEMSDDQYDAAQIEKVISEKIGKKVTAQKMQTYNAKDANSKINMLQLKVSKNDTLSGEEMNKVVEILKQDFKVKEEAQMQVQSVDPFIGRELLEKGILAAIIASVLIIVYVWWRFSVMSGLSAAIFANLALIHDAFVMFAVYTIFRMPLNESFVAAVLTILGYSINDTIVIYDRIRENTRTMKKMPYSQLVNTSVIQTMARSINTTLTVLICIITVYVFAKMNNIQSIQEFSLPLIVGLVSGTYSTIFIASPLWAMWQEAKLKRKVAVKASKA
ncbi:MAG: protein translocase subunit SecF [Clostridia bacterium]|nr:protein translocase subunit SecF [Clostridia bacterium]